MAIPYVAAGVTIAATKRAENKKRQAVANEFSKKYPLVDNSASMDISIQNALNELKTYERTPAETSRTRRVKERNIELLKKWMLVMKGHKKDLQSGINVASTQVAQQAVPVAVVTAVESTPERAVLPEAIPATPTQEVQDLSQIRPETDVKNAGNLAAPTKEKGVNWLLIAGVVVAVYFGYKFIKK